MVKLVFDNSTTGLLASLLTNIDIVILVLYVGIVVAIGSWVGRRQSTLGDYFLAGRSMPWGVVCVSIVATDLSAISYLGVPAWLYEHDLKYSAGMVLMPLVMLLIVVLFVRVFHQLQVFTVYEYLEHRFNPAVRSATAVLFLLQRGVWLATAIYAPSAALAAVTDWSVVACIVAIGGLATLYTVIGGMKAVIWTDFIQFIVLVGGLLVMIGILMNSLGWDVVEIWARASSIQAAATGTAHTTMIDWKVDFETEATVWAILFFMLVYNVGTYGTDQVAVQRYLTLGTFRQIFKSVVGSGFVNMLSVFLLAWLGILLVVYYDRHPDLAAVVEHADQILPHFVGHLLPAGVRGLILAALFAATMSSVDSALNSFATVGVMDLYGRYVPDALDNDALSLRVGKVVTLLAGLLATLAAIWVSTIQATILQKVAMLASIFIGPITGLFFLGVLTRRTGVIGALTGVLFGLMVSVMVAYGPVNESINWMWTAPLSSMATFVTGYAVSLAIPASVSNSRKGK